MIQQKFMNTGTLFGWIIRIITAVLEVDTFMNPQEIIGLLVGISIISLWAYIDFKKEKKSKEKQGSSDK